MENKMDTEKMEKCTYCNKEFKNKVNLLQHQKTVKSCIKLQGKEEVNTHVECENCKKMLTVRSYKTHKINCDIKYNINKELDSENKELYIRNGELENEIRSLTKKIEDSSNNMKDLIDKYEGKINDLIDRYEGKINDLINKYENKIDDLNYKHEDKINDLTTELKDCKDSIFNLKMELVEHKSYNTILREQNDKIQSISTGVTMKLAERATTVNTNNNKIIINMPLTNEVLRKCAHTFTIDNAYNINGITEHLASSLENHVICTDPSRNIFKYLNEKEEEIVDKDLEILIPQYLTVVKDRNNFLYKEVFEYLKKNKMPFDSHNDYQVFYQALNNIIERSGYKDKYTERYKQHMVRECKRRFLSKNKNKNKAITKKLTDDEIIMNIIETGGTLSDFINKFFPEYNNDEETEEQFEYRRQMEDLFRQKKQEWKRKQKEIKENKGNAKCIKSV